MLKNKMFNALIEIFVLINLNNAYIIERISDSQTNKQTIKHLIKTNPSPIGI